METNKWVMMIVLLFAIGYMLNKRNVAEDFNWMARTFIHNEADEEGIRLANKKPYEVMFPTAHVRWDDNEEMPRVDYNPKCMEINEFLLPNEFRCKKDLPEDGPNVNVANGDEMDNGSHSFHPFFAKLAEQKRDERERQWEGIPNVQCNKCNGYYDKKLKDMLLCNCDDRDNTEKFFTSNKEKYLIDQYDDPVDKANSFRLQSNDMLVHKRIKDVYDALTKQPDRARKCVYKPDVVDPVSHEGVYLSTDDKLNLFPKADMWMYQSESDMNGGHMGNGIYANDPLDFKYPVIQTY
jgi:hypothetical protein